MLHNAVVGVFFCAATVINAIVFLTKPKLFAHSQSSRVDVYVIIVVVQITLLPPVFPHRLAKLLALRLGQTRDFVFAKSKDFVRIVINLARLSRLTHFFERFRKTFAVETFQSGAHTFGRFRPVQPFAQ